MLHYIAVSLTVILAILVIFVLTYIVNELSKLKTAIHLVLKEEKMPVREPAVREL